MFNPKRIGFQSEYVLVISAIHQYSPHIVFRLVYGSSTGLTSVPFSADSPERHVTHVPIAVAMPVHQRKIVQRTK